ncbi:hypothetical protein DICPUDRAFT_157916 [Dictyostelium purpureum]|uniref:Purple acid phosphatase N-terminal domain-containing protein n=1 Tax=Dictyostelium purpureum TaxID=5786 RepID=F1A0C3_DICPU|nr:uncharacterized protein DICPUDRAFT_157916 [Dictyostelium purpureum]EGC30353.1 hypothetical protein DICPUDRAFT_157916 [Dictyostelium purpureum]|eukprot:XP_003293123.1 hypothetical protein DICPUDRAFT_157916 [Dictyostelium purpureum]
MNFSVEEKTLLGIGILDIFLILLFLLHFIIIYNISKKKCNNLGDVKLKNAGEEDQYDGFNKDKKDGKKKYEFIEFKNRRNHMAIFIESVAALVIFELLVLALVMFDKLHIAAGIIIMYVVAAVHWISLVIPSKPQAILNTIEMPAAKKWLERNKLKIHNFRENMVYWFGLFVILCAILALTIVLEGTCEDQLSFIDSRIIRKYLTPTCAATGFPCYVYLTLNQSPHNSIIANFHTSLEKGDKVPTPICKYDTTSISATNGSISNYQFSASGNYYEMPLEVIRYVNWVHLENLQPNTTYYFRCGSDENGYSEERKFKTQTDDPNQSYSFVVSGDVDVTENSVMVSKVAASQSPDFAMVGGDLAYDHAQYTCYRIVDKWLNHWQTKMITPDGFYIPLVASIGNHEVIGDYGASRDRIPFFVRYFPQVTKSTDPGKNNVDDRPTYNTINIGGPTGTVIFNLDSGHAATLEEQSSWMDQKLSSEFNSTQLRFSLYHVPMYPTIREYENPKSKALRESWLSIFDKYHFNIGFENHDHAYKRTHPLFNDQVVNDTSKKSTVYIGDGSWGTGTRPLPYSGLKWYQSFSKSAHYISSITINTNKKLIEFKSLDENGDIFDEGNIPY